MQKTPVHRPPSGDTLTTVLRRQAEHLGDDIAYTELGRDGREVADITYTALDTRVRAVATDIRQTARSGDRALVYLPPGIDFVIAFLACSYAGVMAVPVPYPDSPFGNRKHERRLRHIVADARPSVVLTTDRFGSEESLTEIGSGAPLRPVVVPDVPAELAWAWQDPGGDTGTPLLVQYTSGSTSAPKGVILTQGNMTGNLAGLDRNFARHTWGSGQGRDLTNVTWLPPFHDMGLSTLLFPLYAGGRCVLMSPVTFLLHPLLWLETMSAYGAQVTTGPNFAFDLCVDRIPPAERGRLDLTRWEAAVCGAEPVRARTLDRFTDAFAPGGFGPTVFMPSYGLAEATVHVSGARRQRRHEVVRLRPHDLEARGLVRDAGPDEPSRSVVSCGPPADNVTVRIVDGTTGLPAAPDQAGEIWLAGDSVGQGYWRNDTATEATFGKRLPGEEGRFLRTGDVGFMRDGELYVVGRADDVLIIDGRNVHPQDVELTVTESHPATSGGTAAVFLHQEGEEARVVAVVEPAARGAGSGGPARTATAVDQAALVREVRRAVAEEHQVGLSDVVLLRPGRLPRTTSGKVQRKETKNLYLGGGLGAWRWSEERTQGDTHA
ncbi:fatty acyl-AMP ligase [Streptomyces sp. CJ_13]|uniref:fatty acyl-AMP ligase n=1 Tax=Streptomyces sp. CJ_13 TaxID=2724943 RepID=UPI001BDDB069|nr:fatty acyl-AMP ligase [Streptomyces sp. CJ_13]MBT1186225.1 fatty acyl-AMP ligase [Streptomyces sp. CJ_13]